jgi:monolysocardiolipin acyltransferase
LLIVHRGRIVGSAIKLPVVIPVWITGFNKLMPEGRPFPYKYIPKIGQHLSVTFGKPISREVLEENLKTGFEGVSENEQIRRRIAVTDTIHDAVEALGRSVSGDSLEAIPSLR